jgi:outer membrane protein TolC
MLPLEGALSHGLENNFNIKLAGKTKEIAYNNYTWGNAGFLPTLILGGSRNFSNQNVTQVFIDGRENSRDGAKTNTWNGNAALNWTLFDGLSMFNAYGRLGEQKQIGDLNQRFEIEINVADIIIAYYRVILEKNALAALDSSLNLSRVRVELTKTRYELGKIPKLDYLSAQVDFNTDSTLLIQQFEALGKSKNNLNNIIARCIATAFDVPGEIPLDSSLILDHILDEAMVANSNLNRLRKEVDVSMLEAKEIRGEKIPSLNLNVGYVYSDLSSEAGFLLSNNARGVNYGLSASWTVFQGDNISRRYQNSIIEQERSQLVVDQQRLQLETEIRDMYLEYQNNLNIARLEKQNLEVALEFTSIAIDRYNLGKSTFIELREAQVNSVLTYGRLITAIFNTKVAETELLRFSGRILPLYGVISE